jgi:glycerophosphoryl diester phosphodiesterase
LLVLAGPSDQVARVFHDEIPVGEPLLAFGAIHSLADGRQPADALMTGQATNYRRWWNNPWIVVESVGQQKAETWTSESQTRLRQMVEQAHQHGLWIRFYTLDGATPSAQKENGWFRLYNFTRERAEERWQALMEAGADYIASDHYEQLSEALTAYRKRHCIR